MSSINSFSESIAPSSPVIVGRITTVHGIKGWVKVHSYTEDPEKILQYKPWWLDTSEGWKKIEVNAYKVAGQNLIIQVCNFDDRDIARQELCQRDIAVERSEFPKLDVSEHYWYQLKGLRVATKKESVDLGVVVGLMQTGANDVLQIKGDAHSLDLKERLLPCTKQVILSVNLKSNKIEVNWDPEF